MSELKVDTIKTYTPSVNGIQFPNGLYVNNTKIASNNTVETGQFIGIPAPAAAYPVPSGVNAMVSLGYFNSIIAAITGASGLATVSAQVVAAENNAKDYSDNNFLRKNTSTEHNGGGLTFSGGPYTIFTNTTPTLNLRSNNPRLQLTETDTAGSTGTISMDSGVLKILYGDNLSSTNGLLINSDGRVTMSTVANSNYRLTAIPTNSAVGYGAVLGYTTNTSYFGILGYNGNADTNNLATSFYGSGYLFNSGKAKITDTLLLTNAVAAPGNSLLTSGGVAISGQLSVTGNSTFNNDLFVGNNLTVDNNLTLNTGTISGFMASSYTPAIEQTHYTKVKSYMGNFREEIHIDVLDTTITPRKTNSKILVSVNLSGEFRYSQNVGIRLYRVVGGVETPIGNPTTTLGPTILKYYGYDWNAGWGTKPSRTYNPTQAGVGADYTPNGQGATSAFIIQAGIKTVGYDADTKSTIENCNFQYLDTPNVSAGTAVTYRIYMTGFQQADILDRLYLNISWALGYNLRVYGPGNSSGYYGNGPDTYQIGAAPGGATGANTANLDAGNGSIWEWERSTSSMLLQEFFV